MTTPSGSPLLPCPFCGEQPLSKVRHDTMIVWCGNTACRLSPSQFGKDEWNTRAGSLPPVVPEGQAGVDKEGSQSREGLGEQAPAASSPASPAPVAGERERLAEVIREYKHKGYQPWADDSGLGFAGYLLSRGVALLPGSERGEK